MCGIVGYVGARQATPALLGALRKLEYRGYDSAGIAVLSGGGLVVEKAKGMLQVLEDRIAGREISGCLGIGHTRWATHGEPSDVNAHPQTNTSGTIAVVHNGIVENHQRLKEWLQSQGVVFRTRTDTETIAHLINYYYRGNIFDAVLKTLHKLEGAYALCVISSDFPDRLIAAKKENPLVLGFGRGENFVASDVPALLEHTREVYYMDEGEIAAVYGDHVDVFTGRGERIIPRVQHVDWDVDAAEKGGYEHFMLKEMHEQPRAIADTVKPRIIDAPGGGRDIFFEELPGTDFWKDASRVVIAACGTAWHAGVVARYAFERFARIPTEAETASEYRYKNPILDSRTVFIVVSQSGETADTLAAVRLAKSRGARVMAITNVVGSTLSREADVRIYTRAGPEIAVASTKAFTTQLVCLYLLALKAGFVRGALSPEDYQKGIAELLAVPDKAAEILARKGVIQKEAALQFNKNKVFFIGRLFDYAAGLESALKLKEISYTHSEAFAAGELKHGPIALVDDRTLVIALATQRALFDKIASNIAQVSSRGAVTLAITQDTSGYFDQAADQVFVIPQVDDAFSPLLSVIPAQLFAYYCAIQKGNNPDRPRNLAKSVTVE
ncbi:MAG: glutamine--fructose-6-phosphate transaminase (isomerizing) [Spirochaetaceae bacterium]|jgi:glucosamine--fructose-6-phosphate aminotransferase (isomerizing)|nr:glutamine--fructose-6-phosphate transaminase (isomerizing) [Spirochaetaceae bacterium]